MTEGVSSDGKTVNEKAHMLEAPTRTLKVNGQAVEGTEVTVAANSTAKITYTFVLGDSDRAWLTKFENGMYVEGYATLTNTDEEGISLNVPYLAFYGDWADAPMMDYDQYEVSKDANDDTIDDDDKRYSNNRALMLIGKIVENNVEYSMPMGQFPFFIPEEFEALTPDTSEEYCALSYDNDTGMYGLFCAAGFLRNAKKLFWQRTDAVSGDIIMEGAYGDARKALAAGSTGGAWVELDLGLDIELVNNRKYNFAIYPVLDWNAEQFYVYDANQYHERFNSEGLDVQASIQKVIEYNEAYNAAHPEKERRYTWDSDFWVDTDAPIISDTEVRIVRDKRDNATYYIDFYFTDNHYLSAMGFDYYNKDAKDFESLFSEAGMRPIISERNSTTLVSFNITDLWEQINEGIMYRNTHNAAEVEANPELGEYLTQLQIQVFDYAFNTSFYEIDLYDLLVPASSLAFGDIGTYTEYKSGDETVRVMTAYGDTVKEDANGNKLTMNQITLVPGQKVELMKAVSPFIGGTWREDLIFSTNVGGNVLRVDEETGEIYVPASIQSQSPVSATVTVRSRANSSVYATLTVNILTDEEVDKFNINTGRLQAPSTITSLGFEDVMYKEFNAGESYVVEIKPDPWYVDFDTEKYFIQWSTGSDLIATVRATTPADGADYSPLKAVVTANNGYYYNDANGNNKHDSGEEICEVGQGAYAANLSGTIDIVATLCQYADNGKYETADGKKYNTTFYTATFYAGVKEEFVLEGNQLTEYNGTPVSYTVDGKTYDKTVIIPSNLKIKTIKDNLFYRREDINAVVLNEGLETVGYASFAYMINLEYVKLPSTINKISDYGFAAYNPTTETNPQTKLTIVDTTACAKPLQVGQLGFALQRYIGVDLDASNIVDYDNPSAFGNNIVLYEENKFDMSKFRNVDNYGLYETGHFLRTIDLSNLRMSGEAAFYGIGSGLPKFIKENGAAVYAEAIFGKNTILGDAALAGSGIGKVNLPMQRITYQAFFGNTGTTGEGDDASSEFINDGTLKEIEISGENVIIEEGAFLYSSVQKLVISGSIEYMGDAAFAYCENLSEIEYKDGATVKEIGHQAFYNCSSLREFTLPAGLTVLGNGSLAESKNLKTINIAAGCNLGELGVNNLDEIVSSPFYGCTNLEEFTVEAGNTTYYAENGVLYNADKTELIMVACKKSFADGELNQLLSGVTRIGNFAFSSNASVTSVDLSGITDLGIGAFFDCTNLTEVQFSDDLEVIPAASFYNCTSLRNARLSSNSKLETVGEFAFYETAITSINLPAMLRTIEPAAFAYTDLTSFTVPTRVTAIADDTFYECRSLSTVNFHNNVNSIGVRAFAYSAIREVSAANCRTVGEAAFASCSNLTTVNLPQVRRIDTYAFMAEVSSGADGSAVSRGGITNLTLTNVTSIGGYAFYYQTKLSVLTFNSLTSIGEYAFFGCSTLEQMQLPKIETIGQNAFSTSSIFAVYPSTAQGKGYAAVLPTTLVDIDPTAFADTMIGEYSINNDRYMTDNGVLYRILPEGGYELVSYPCYKQESMEYTIMDGTVRIAEYAFCFTEYLYRVNIPACVQSIGDSAFYGTSVRIFNFDTLVAPILEASHQTMTTESGDVYFWQVYNNFYLPFSFSNGEYSGFKYNPIRFKTEEEDAATVIDPVSGTEMQIQNTAYTAEDLAAGMSHYWYGITICRPSNAKGFDDLIWGNYFDSVLLTPELLEDATVTVMDLIRALPNADSITEANRAQVERARNRFEALGSDQQRAFIRAEGLVDVLVAAETKLATVAAENNTAVNNVITLIAALPAESALTLENKAAVEAARAAYNALSAENKATLDANVIAMQKLTQSEAKIAKLEAGEGEGTEDDGEGDTDASDCGTVAPLSGGSNGGNGLMVGLAAAVAIALVAVFSRKKQRN
ncbi:MAG: leucine-rich repeat protein [Clostridia bacterium]|nr:leucine-rich repeat protein [Clostridia bacterium]